MSDGERGDRPPSMSAVALDPDVEAALGEARRQIRAPWAASIAGLLFAVLFSLAIVMLRLSPLLTATDAEIPGIFTAGGDLPAVIAGLYFMPLSGVMFLWFVAVARDQIGEREDRFFATVFFGSGLMFVTLVFTAAAAGMSGLVGFRYLGLGVPTAEAIEAGRTLSYTLLFAFASRAAAVFLISLGTIGLRSRAFPNWVGWSAYLFGAALLLFVAMWDWVLLILPTWVAIVSLFILRRERRRRRAHSVPA